MGGLGRGVFALGVLSSFLLSSGCGGFVWDTTTAEQREATTRRLRAMLGAAGYEFQEGAFHWLNVEEPANPLVSYGALNGKNSPYAAVSFLPVDGEYVGMDMLVPAEEEALESLIPTFRLPEDGAIVVMMRTPPEGRAVCYQGYRPVHWSPEVRKHVLSWRHLHQGKNHLNLNTGAAPGEPPSEQMTVLIFTADKGLDRQLRQLLGAAGVSEGWFNTFEIPHWVQLGMYKRETDPLAFVIRMALTADPAARAAYMQETPAVVGRITRRDGLRGRLPVRRFGEPTFADPGRVANEQELQPYLDELVQRIREYHEGQGYHVRDVLTMERNMVGLEQTDFMAILGALSSTDCVYGASAPILIDHDPESFCVVLGVNHYATGMSCYTALIPYALPTAMPARPVTDLNMPGSTEWYLDEMGVTDPTLRSTALEKFGVFRFARPEVLAEEVIELPETWDPLPEDLSQTSMPAYPKHQPIIFGSRSYVDPVTGWAPKAEDLVRFRVLYVSPRRFWPGGPMED